jgi:hypothetical protein
MSSTRLTDVRAFDSYAYYKGLLNASTCCLASPLARLNKQLLVKGQIFRFPACPGPAGPCLNTVHVGHVHIVFPKHSGFRPCSGVCRPFASTFKGSPEFVRHNSHVRIVEATVTCAHVCTASQLKKQNRYPFDPSTRRMLH